MTTPSNRNVKWIIIGSIILVLAILIAVAPILVTKYMRSKWENSPNYKVSHLLMNVSGILQKAQDSTLYIKGNNNLYYVLEDVKENVDDKVGAKCTVIGKMRKPAEDEMVDGNPVRLFIGVNKLMFPGDTFVVDNEQPSENEDNDIKDKVIKKAKLRVEINTKLNKPIMFDVTKGKVSSETIKDNNNNDIVVYVLVDDFGDKYMLYKKGADLSVLENKEVACLGREILPPNNMPLIVDQTTFEIYEVYDANYNRLI